MKKILSMLLVWGATLIGLAACGGGSDDPDVDPQPQGGLSETVTQRTCSVKEGAEVEASEVTAITISYNTTVSIATDAKVTLNGQTVHPQSGKTTKMEIDIPVSLEAGQSYTLSVPSGTVLATTDAKRTAKAFTLNFTTKKAPSIDLPDNEAMAVTRKIGFGWNLGNHFDSYATIDGKEVPVPESWGSWWDKSTPTAALYQKLAAAGVKTVRIPVTWGVWQGEAPLYPIDADYMKTVKQNVLWAKAAGLTVVLNTHHDEYWQDPNAAAGNAATNEAIKVRLAATWKQIAEAFKEEGDYLILETLNEIHNDDDWGTGASASARDGGVRYGLVNEWNQVCVDAIRATGGENAKRWIAVPGFAASPSITMNSLTLPNDPAKKIIVAVHCYDPYNFTLAEKLTDNFGRISGSANDEDQIVKLFGQLKAKYIDQNIPCYLGEFGCSAHSSATGIKARNYYLEFFCRAAYLNGLGLCIWDNQNPGTGSEHHAYFNHSTGAWEDNSEQLVKTMINAATSNDATYTLESIYQKHK